MFSDRFAHDIYSAFPLISAYMGRGYKGLGMVWYGSKAWTLGFFACLWDS